MLTSMPKCADGRVCEKKNNGFVLVPWAGNIFVCGDCYLKMLEDRKKASVNPF